MKCWYCGQETMEEAPNLGKGWFECSSCFATWIKVPKLGAETIVEERRSNASSPNVTRYRPSLRQRGIRKRSKHKG